MPSWAQSAKDGCAITLSGKIIDSDSGEPLPASTVTLSPQLKRLISDERGSFSFGLLCAGTYTLEVQTVGYTPYKKQLVLSKGQSLTVRLHQQDVALGEVEISGHRSASASPNTAASISGRELDMTKGGTLAASIQSIPGVNMLQTGATIAKPVIHGLHSNRILILNNGIRQEGQQWGSEHAPEIDPFIAKNITVVKGSEAIRYGADALGGVVLVEPPALPSSPPLHVELNAAGSSNGRGIAGSATLSGGITKWKGFGWRLQGTTKKAGNVRSADYYLDNTGVKEINYSAAAGYTSTKMSVEGYFSHFNTKLGILKDSHIGNVNDLITRISFGRPFFDVPFSYGIDAPMQKIRHDLFKLKGHLHLADGTNLNATYGFQFDNREEYDQRRVLTGKPTLDMHLSTHTLDLNIEKLNEQGWKRITGISLVNQVNNSVQGTGVTPLIPNYDSFGAGAYAIVRHIKNERELEAGLRYEYKYLDALGYNRDKELYGGTHHFNNLSASLGGVWHFGPKWHLRSNLGLAWRPPAVSELYSNGLHHGTVSYEIGDANLKAERSYKWLNSIEYQTEKLSFELDGYINHIEHYIYLKPSLSYFENIRGAFPVYNYTQTNARLIGADLNLTYHLTPYIEYGLKGSVIRARDVSNNAYLPWIPSDRVRNSVKLTLPEKKTFSGSFLEFGYRFTARQDRYEPESDYASPPPAYHLFDASVGTEWKTRTNSLLVSLTAENLTNRLYKEYLNRFRYFAHDLGRNVTFRATWRF